MSETITLSASRFNIKQFSLLLFCFLLMDGIFAWIVVRNSLVIEGYIKLMQIGIYGFLLYKYRDLENEEKVYVALFTLIILRLVGESLIEYNHFFKQLTMFLVLFPVLYVIFTKYLLRKMDVDALPFTAGFYMITYIIFMLLFGRGFSFSLDQVEMDDYGPFSGDSRIMHARHIFMMIIPLLWYLNEYVVKGRSRYLVPVLLCVGIILVHQHRSVWSSALVAVFFYCFAAIRNGILKSGRIVQVTVGALAIIGLCYFFASNLMPGFVNFLSDRFSEILNPAKEGSTGNFRLEQREVYFKLFLERPIFGWTFEGFEMPNPMVDWWPPMTGQHFHEGYMEMLFYHGIVGIVFKYSFLVYLAIKAFSKNLSGSSIILIAFGISGLVFSLNYVLPHIFWVMIGMCLYYLEKDRILYKKNKSDELHMHLALR